MSPSYAIWQAYDSGAKAELVSTAIRTGRGGVVIFDPIPLAADARLELGKVETVLITNANHARAASDFADAGAIFIPAELANELPKAGHLADEMRVAELTVIAIRGAALGEFAFYDARNGGALIVGDAIINFEPHGFSLLPAKYCVDRKQMIRSLRRLLDFTFNRMFFAHGSPIMTRARDRFTTLLDGR